jgi:hypothetical protein
MKKKVLLIGIGYKESKSQEQSYMPHGDVTQLKAFLISKKQKCEVPMNEHSPHSRHIDILSRISQ